MAQSKTEEELAGTATQQELPLDKTVEYAQHFAAAELRHELDLIPAEEFSRAIGPAEQTLATWRSNNEGPAFIKLGKTVFYQRKDIKEWIERCRTNRLPVIAPGATTNAKAA